MSPMFVIWSMPAAPATQRFSDAPLAEDAAIASATASAVL